MAFKSSYPINISLFNIIVVYTLFKTLLLAKSLKGLKYSFTVSFCI